MWQSLMTTTRLWLSVLLQEAQKLGDHNDYGRHYNIFHISSKISMSSFYTSEHVPPELLYFGYIILGIPIVIMLHAAMTKPKEGSSLPVVRPCLSRSRGDELSA